MLELCFADRPCPAAAAVRPLVRTVQHHGTVGSQQEIASQDFLISLLRVRVAIVGYYCRCGCEDCASSFAGPRVMRFSS